MKTINKIKLLVAFVAVGAGVQSAMAQSKADVFDESKPITWLGLDFSQTKFVGTAANTSLGGVVHAKDDAAVTNDQFRDQYTVAWNQLFIDEAKKYNVAKSVHRTDVQYAIDVTAKANKGLTKKDFFTNNPSDYKLITEANIAELVKKYDFQKHTGIGLIFFVEGMSKGKESASVWVTFVDMGSKTVLLTNYMSAKPGGFGFRNYWAKPFALILKDVESDYSKWKKG